MKKNIFLCGKKICLQINYFIELEYPRVDRTKDHLLEDIIFITIAAVICGAETWKEIEDDGKSNLIIKYKRYCSFCHSYERRY